jgi:hypothetical protein
VRVRTLRRFAPGFRLWESSNINSTYCAEFEAYVTAEFATRANSEQ